MDWRVIHNSWLMVLLYLPIICYAKPGSQKVSLSTDDNYDPEHGVKMGISRHDCDDGLRGISIDWDSSQKWVLACYSDDIINTQEIPVTLYDDTDRMPQHVCLDKPIDYDTDLPLSGDHRPLWPKYGEYVYLPPQRWVHSLEHGAIVLLYHPCVRDDSQLVTLKNLVRSSLDRHVISPYRRIPHHMPFALLAYKKALLIGDLNRLSRDLAEEFIQTNALNAPEKDVAEDGQYSYKLIKSSMHSSEVNGKASDKERAFGEKIRNKR